jgi:hypothetical protein
MNIYLYASESTATEIRLSDPTNLRGLLFQQIIDDSVSFTDSIISEFSLIESDVFTLSESIEKGIFINESDLLTYSDLIAKEQGLMFTDPLSFTESLVKQLDKGIIDNVLFTELVSKSIDVKRSDSLTLSDIFDKIFNKSLFISDIVSYSDSLLKEYSFFRNFDDSVNLTDNLRDRFLDRVLVIINRLSSATLNLSPVNHKLMNIESSIYSKTPTIESEITSDVISIESTIRKNLTITVK